MHEKDEPKLLEMTFEEIVFHYFEEVFYKRPEEVKLVLRVPYKTEKWFRKGSVWVGPGGQIVQIIENQPDPVENERQ